jgi:hypothetical protein
LRKRDVASFTSGGAERKLSPSTMPHTNSLSAEVTPLPLPTLAAILAQEVEAVR